MATPDDQFKKGQKSAEDFTNKVEEEIASLQDAFTSLGDALANSFRRGLDGVREFDDATERVVKRFSRDLSNSINRISLSLDKQLDLQNKINQGADITKELSKERQRVEENRLAIQNRIEILERNGVDISQDQVAELQKQFNIDRDILNSLEKQNEERNKLLGLTGRFASGLDGVLKKIDKTGSLSKVLDIEDAVTKTIRYARQSGKGATGFKKAAFFTKSLGRNLKGNIKDVDLVAFLAREFFRALQQADKATGELAKNFGISYNEAADLRNELNQIANLSGDTFISTKGLQESLSAISQELGTNTMLSSDLLIDFTKLTEQAGYTKEAALALSKITLATNGDLSENTSEFIGQVAALNAQTGLAINEKQLLQDIGNISKATQLTLGLQTEELAKASFEAKKLGLSLKDVESISKNLLQFETSIGSELEAELLTNRQLNLELARTAALQGDIATVAQEVASQIGSAEQFSNMNVIQQEALAKAVGLTREQLAESLIEREALANIGAADAAQARARFDQLVATYGYEKAIQELGDERYGQQLASQSIQDRFNKSIEKLRELFVSLAEPVLQIISPFVDLVTSILPLIQTLLYPITKTVQFIGSIFGKITGGLTTGSQKLTAGVTKSLVTGDDVISPGYGERMILSPEGTVALNNQDTVVAGTSLNQGGSSNNEVVTLLRELITEVKAGGTITIDGQAVGKALTMASYSTGS